jgi:hypothetical protein
MWEWSYNSMKSTETILSISSNLSSKATARPVPAWSSDSLTSKAIKL